MRETITELIRNVISLDANREIKDDENLIDLGLDSIKTIEIVVELEDGFDIEIDEDDLMLDNFSTISKIMELVKRYKYE
jgi:acyl carrier protein